MVDNASCKIARQAGVEPSRFVGHEINPESLHEAGGILPPHEQRSRFLGLPGKGMKDSRWYSGVRPRNGGGKDLGFRSVYRFQAVEERALPMWSLGGDRVCRKVRAAIFQPAKQDDERFRALFWENIRLK